MLTSKLLLRMRNADIDTLSCEGRVVPNVRTSIKGASKLSNKVVVFEK